MLKVAENKERQRCKTYERQKGFISPSLLLLHTALQAKDLLLLHTALQAK